MASFTPVDVVRLAPVFRHRVPDEDLHLGSILSPSTSFPRNRYCERASPMSTSPPSSAPGSSPRRRSPASMTVLTRRVLKKALAATVAACGGLRLS